MAAATPGVAAVSACWAAETAAPGWQSVAQPWLHTMFPAASKPMTKDPLGHIWPAGAGLAAPSPDPDAGSDVQKTRAAARTAQRVIEKRGLLSIVRHLLEGQQILYDISAAARPLAMGASTLASNQASMGAYPVTVSNGPEQKSTLKKALVVY